MADFDATLDAEVAVADSDRWLTSRFVSDPAARADLIALYAFEAELEAIPKRVTQPLLAEMRFTWWAEQMDGVFAVNPRRGHPVLEALSLAAQRRGLRRGVLDDLIEASIAKVHGGPADPDGLYIAPMVEAARLLGAANPDGAAEAGRVWGFLKTSQGEQARAALPAAAEAARELPITAFPAVLPATLARSPDAGRAVKQVRLLWTTIRGRL